MERLSFEEYLTLEAGRKCHFHYMEKRGEQQHLISECVIERDGDTIHIWAPGTRKNSGAWADDSTRKPLLGLRIEDL